MVDWARPSLAAVNDCFNLMVYKFMVESIVGPKLDLGIFIAF